MSSYYYSTSYSSYVPPSSGSGGAAGTGSGSGCEIITVEGKNCVQSNNFGVGNHNNNEECQMSLSDITTGNLKVEAFTAEAGFDILTLQYGGESAFDYQSVYGNTGGLVFPADGTLAWSSDSSVTTAGWQICETTEDVGMSAVGTGDAGSGSDSMSSYYYSTSYS